MGNINVTHLKDYGLTKNDSSRAQQVAAHHRAAGLEAKDVSPTRPCQPVVKDGVVAVLSVGAR